MIRRIERFFQQHPLCPLDVARFVLQALPDGKRIFILDRTNWKLGMQDVNLLVLAVRWRGVAIPLLWETLDHGGSSNQSIRAELLRQALELLKPHQIRLLIADREFIGADWLAFLTGHRVPFCLRIRADTNVDGLPACEWLPDLKAHERGVIAHEVEVMGTFVNVAVAVSAEGERVVVIGTLRAERLLDCYAARWAVESLFASMKSRGFRLESSHMTRAAHVSRLIGLLTLALVWCALLGAGEARRVLVHGRAAVGMLAAGWSRLIRAFTRAVWGEAATLLELVDQLFSPAGT
ncbi:IS4 family transposase [Deinococcus peraridilitoris]|uniref:Transposase family protein n=1 Tax=Deinococcus peraridilitoris (strain DSM 19664 / LMG 22246 / CIP 109416 / KR-200) TaxID=937777 RepID=K9ZYS9_DEIPD|nr:IS4 family transposase [Deinococcus peraridilitoris]AFZ66359.1 transposase family protein [Deinococcus peraridilitoris DSM 19664]